MRCVVLPDLGRLSRKELGESVIARDMKKHPLIPGMPFTGRSIHERGERTKLRECSYIAFTRFKQSLIIVSHAMRLCRQSRIVGDLDPSRLQFSPFFLAAGEVQFC